MMRLNVVDFGRNVHIHFIKRRTTSNLEVAFEEVLRDPLNNRRNHGLGTVLEDLLFCIL